MVNCSGSSTGAANADFALGAGGGGALGLGTAIARGGAVVAPTSGVSDGLDEDFLCGVGDFSAPAFFFFFDLGEASFTGLFFGFGCELGSGVSLGVTEASDSSLGVFFLFDFGEGVGDFFFFCTDFFGFAVGLGDSSSDGVLTAWALRTGVVVSSSVCCA